MAEKLNITNRAVSKWETGKALPDSAIMMELCDLLHITVNDLMCGERITESALDKKHQEQSPNTKKEKVPYGDLFYSLWKIGLRFSKVQT